MIKILYYMETIGIGGIEQMAYQWISRTDADMHIDIYVREITDAETAKRFKALGCKIYEAKCAVRDIRSKARVLRGILAQNHYDIIHVHTAMATDYWALKTAKECGIKCRIGHSHNVRKFNNASTRVAVDLCKPLIRKYSTHYFACSMPALFALYGNTNEVEQRGVVIKNGIDPQKFKFSLESRITVRHELEIDEEQFVIGSIGRLDEQKNYMYLLEALAEMGRLGKSYCCVLVGDGEERRELERFASENNLDVRFLGIRSDVDQLLCGMDLFVLTSRYEGFPLVTVEAQTCGLDCVVSDAIPVEAIIADNVTRLPLSSHLGWIHVMSSAIETGYCNEGYRAHSFENTIKNGFDIQQCAHDLSERYKQMIANSISL